MLHVLACQLVMYLHQPLLLVLMCQERVAGVTGLVIGGLLGITALGHWEVTRVRRSVERRLPCEHHGQRQSAFSRLCRTLHLVWLTTPGARAAPKLPQPREVLRSLQTMCGESTL